MAMDPPTVSPIRWTLGNSNQSRSSRRSWAKCSRDQGYPAAHIKPDDAVMLGQNGDPCIPELVILGHAVVQDDNLRRCPRVGEIINGIE
jgi:hypothetical protein